MSYASDIVNISPAALQLWKLDGDGLDAIQSEDLTVTGGLFETEPICQEASECWTSNSIVDSRLSLEFGSSQYTGMSEKALGGWFKTDSIQPHPCRIYGEGDANPTFQFVMAMGNNLMLEVGDSTSIAQIFGISLVPNRSYHIFGVMTLITEPFNFIIVKLFIDGVYQGEDVIDTDSLESRATFAEFADPSDTVGVGGDNILLQAPKNGSYNYWVSWEENYPSSTDIREVLFEKGVLPTVTVTDQTELNTYNNTLRGNKPCCILVDVLGDITLDATNITFDPLASIHVQYNGNGVLTWNNLGTSNASIFSTTNGGTVETPTNITITVKVKDVSTLLPIENAMVYLIENGGSEIAKTLTNSSGEVSTSYIHITDKNMLGTVRKATGEFYKTANIDTTITDTDLIIDILMIKDS